MLPVVLLFFVLSALLVLGGASVSSAFIAQRDLAAFCDSAAVAAADEVAERGLFGPSASGRERLPVDASAAEATAQRLAQRRGDGTSVSTRVGGSDASALTLTCSGTVRPVFASLFGQAPFRQTVTATAQSPYR